MVLDRLVKPRGRSAHPSSTPENAESLGRPELVDETPTKHWTTVVVILDEVSVECRCGWVDDFDGYLSVKHRIEQAAAAARGHRKKASGDADYDG